MVLFKDGEKIGECEPYMYGGQQGFQKFLVVIAMLCIPWMFAGKPYLIYKYRQLQAQQVVSMANYNESFMKQGLNCKFFLRHNNSTTRPPQA